MKSHRIVAVTGAVLFGALLVGATDAAAAPPPADPTGIDRPVLDPRDPGDPVPPEPEPRPDVATPATEIAVDDPCDVCPPDDPPDDPATEPAEPEAPADEPEATPQAAPQPSPSAGPVGRPRSAPAGIPTPTRIDTGEGPGGAEAPNWLLIGAPALALLSLAAGGAYLWIRRTDRSAR
jgi:hypothetical protein